MRVHQRHPSSGGDDLAAALARLAGQVDLLRQDVAALVDHRARLREDVDAHTRTLDGLSDLLRRVTSGSHPAGADRAGADPGDEEPGPCPEWMTVTDPGLAIGWLTGLWAWVRDVYAQYTPLPGCWPWHPPVVAELLACHAAWTAAVTPDAALEAIAAWHDRWRPGTAARVSELVEGCRRASGLHLEGAARYDYDPAYLDEYAQHWTTTHNPTAAGAPGLTLNVQDRR